MNFSFSSFRVNKWVSILKLPNFHDITFFRLHAVYKLIWFWNISLLFNDHVEGFIFALILKYVFLAFKTREDPLAHIKHCPLDDVVIFQKHGYSVILWNRPYEVSDDRDRVYVCCELAIRLHGENKRYCFIRGCLHDQINLILTRYSLSAGCLVKAGDHWMDFPS